MILCVSVEVVIRPFIIGVKAELSFDQSLLVELFSNIWLNLKCAKLSVNVAI